MDKFPNGRMENHIIEMEYKHEEIQYTEFYKKEGNDYSMYCLL